MLLAPNSLLRRMLSYCWTITAIVVILFAFMVSITRMLIPLLGEYREDLELVATEQLGQAVKIDNIDAEWIYLWPKIHLSNVRVMARDNVTNWVKLDDVWLSIDLWSLVTRGELNAKRVAVKGLSLDVQRKDESSYIVNGEKIELFKKRSADEGQVTKWFFSRDRLQLIDADLSYNDNRFAGQAVSVTRVNLNLENNSDLHHVYGQFFIPGEPNSSLLFVADLQGDMSVPTEVSSHLYVKGNVYVASWLQQWAAPYIRLKKGEMEIQAWVKGKLKQLENVRLSMRAVNLLWNDSSQQQQQDSKVDLLSLQAFWQRQQQGWSLNIEDLSLAHDDVEWPAADSSIVYTQASESQAARIEVGLGYARLEDIAGVLSNSLPQTLALKKIINQSGLAGELRNVKLHISPDQMDLSQYYLDADYVDLGFNSWQGLPGLAGLDGHVTMSDNRALLRLQSKNTTLDFGKLFIKPIQLRQLQGDVQWQFTEQGHEISFAQLQADNQHINTRTRANINIPSQDESAFVDMQVDFDKGLGEFTSLYLPQGLMSKGSEAWLNKAFLEGKVSTGRMLLHGRTADYPFGNDAGTFIVDFDVEDVVLDYAAGWPQLKKVDASVLFSDSSVTVDIHSAELMGIKLLSSRAHIADMHGDSVLDLKLAFDGKAQQWLKFLHDTPIGKDARDFLATARGNGRIKTKVDMQLPLSQAQGYKLEGQTEFLGNDLDLSGWKQEFKQVSGLLNFDSDGKLFRFDSENLQCHYHGRLSRLDVSTAVDKKRKAKVTVAMKTRQTVTAMLSSFYKTSEKLFSGSSEWKVALNLLQNKRATLSVSSNLKGTAINLPDQFSKPANQKRFLRVDANLFNGNFEAIYASLGNVFKSVFKLKTKKGHMAFDRGEFRFGKGRLRLPKNSGLVIKGKLASLSLGKWAALMPPSKGSPSTSALFSLIEAIDIKISKLLLGSSQYKNISLKVRNEGQSLRADVKMKELAGRIDLADEIYGSAGSTPININLDYLHLKTGTDKQESSVPDPRVIPAFTLTSKKVLYNKKPLGSLSIVVRRDEDGLLIDEANLKGKLVDAESQGSWKYVNSWHESRFDIKVNAPRIDKLMQAFGYKAGIKEGKLDTQLSASWSGPPHWLEMKRLNGNMHLQIKKGRLSDVDPGGGRIFGLLNIHTIGRRLTLDFKDMFKEGLSFDTVAGSFTISEGDAYTSDLYLDGPAAKIDITGRIGLSAEDYDQIVAVTPKVSSSLPLLGLVAGPQVAIGLFVTEKLFRKKINKLSVTSYSVTGPWDKPEVKKLNVKTEAAEQEANDE